MTLLRHHREEIAAALTHGLAGSICHFAAVTTQVL